MRLLLALVTLAFAAILMIGVSSGSAANSSQYVASNPHVYDATTPEYTNRYWSWDEWTNRSYIAYLFKSNGDLYAGPWSYPNGGDGTYYPPGANIYYWKEYNNSGGLDQFTVSYCC